MSIQRNKVLLTASPVARVGGGDISEHEHSRERYTLQTSTPQARVQKHNPKKQLFSAPVNKFTAKVPASGRNLARVKSCLDGYKKAMTTPVRPVKLAPKAVSMEDLTPIKKGKLSEIREDLVKYGPRSAVEQEAAARIGRFMMLSSWRRRRQEVRCLKKTLTFQVTCSERLRIQVSTLKSLLDSDNAKVRMAMKELERLKNLLREKELEKQVLENEKKALENDICAAEDKVSEMNIGWRNTLNELQATKLSASNYQNALVHEQAVLAETMAARDRAYTRINELEEENDYSVTMLANSEEEVESLKKEVENQKKALEKLRKKLEAEHATNGSLQLSNNSLTVRLNSSAEESLSLRRLVGDLRDELVRVNDELKRTKEQLDWWPRPLTKMLGVARCWLRSPGLSHAVLWAAVPVRHGC